MADQTQGQITVGDYYSQRGLCVDCGRPTRDHDPLQPFPCGGKPMTDSVPSKTVNIIAELRSAAASDDGVSPYCHDRDLCNGAADEIERLREIIIDAHGTLYHGDCDCSVCSLPETNP